MVIAGFENHGGRTYLGDGAEPLGTGARAATATTAPTGSRASAADNLIGTYLHGPLLPKNACARRPPDRARARPPRGPDAAARAARRRLRSRGAPFGDYRGGSVEDPWDSLSDPMTRIRRSARALSPSASTATARTGACATTSSWAIRSPGLDLEALARVGVEQQHPQLAAVAGVDQARGELTSAIPCGRPGPSAAGPARRGPPGSRPRARCRPSRARRRRPARAPRRRAGRGPRRRGGHGSAAGPPR